MDEPSKQMYKRSHKIILYEFIYMNFEIVKTKLLQVKAVGTLHRDEVVTGRGQQGILRDWHCFIFVWGGGCLGLCCEVIYLYIVSCAFFCLLTSE